MTAGTEYTIDQLAREAGTTVRSLRVYHERGVLPPPQVKGRTGFYGTDHLNRVRTISRLLDRGIKLNGIKELLNAWDRGDDLGDILGVAEPGAVETAAIDAGETIAATELAERYRDVPNGLARVVATGLYEPVDAATYRIADRRLAHSFDRMTAAGVPPDDVLGELEKLRADADRIARRFVDLFRRTAWASFQDSGRGPADVADLAQRLDATRVIPGETAVELVNHFVTKYLDEDTEFSEALPQD
ncbi:MerR family transcriptional regulator [Nocardia sp. NBC_00508]|uniref:MerR family transcriptional regulator n=1 Tax=Nocardia sp. NBC_00508 TaxID=2975992 RepID=UPI002E8216D2|nr:MerR family transcriptional regulator [Nocardia sp. NBC_00508]WUD68112.1 MerR family transcriptional regulator [Nocardia sp. NBC_00508]